MRGKLGVKNQLGGQKRKRFLFGETRLRGEI